MLLKDKRIFVVEDDPINMAIISVALKEQGGLVIPDPWNSDTIARLKTFLPVDIILLDLMLRHGVSGYDIYARLKTHPELANIPVLVISASDPSIEMTRARGLGINGYIAKPIRRASFARDIAAALSGEPIWSADTTY
jgi:CheY-like chemotaxis protein